MRSPEQLAQSFREMGRKVTPQRYVIWQALEGDGTHPTAEALYQRVRRRMPTISRKTVYQVLHELEELGEISSIDPGTGALRFDPNVESSHHHLVCTGCGAVRDLFADFSGLRPPEDALKGFEVGEPEVIFRGLCPACRGRAKEQGNK